MSLLEDKSREAQKLKAFRGTDITLIKDSVSNLLSLFGREGFFSEYTRHDISHINEMLELCEWIIPEKTKAVMTLGDYFMLTLAIYFHDLGLLVTKDEFKARKTNGDYLSYIDDIRNKKHGSVLQNFEKEKIESEERFIYQEYVRKNHASRINKWIYPKNSPRISLTESERTISKEITKLLSNLPENFKMDLGMLCESHHLDDLDDLNKYRVNAHYGANSDETVNLQYIAIILRTADLLHITNDRTPSVQFNVINPENTISILEWQKQQAVIAIKPKDRRNNDGNIDKSLQAEEIEITAHFDGQDKADAYFGLMYYLQYVKQQFDLTQSFIEIAQKKEGKEDYHFPWKSIDSESRITTIGFEKKKFQFKMNQQNILNLLIGHTLYNDSSVVLRELIQNGIDAVKLLDEIEGTTSDSNITIEWDTNKKILSVTDTGTGMTIDDIEKYFLNVGVSKYRTIEFKKEHPNFSPISRFGIGALSCFMIADNIDVITKSKKEDTVNHISIRNVNNQYLLKKINTNDADVPSQIQSHGTKIQLYIRDNVSLINVQDILNHWILFPYCPVTLITDGEKHKIGYSSPKSLLESVLEKKGIKNHKIEIFEQSIDGVTIAFATHLLPYYNDYSFYHDDMQEGDSLIPTGLAIDGIRIHSNTPGYKGKNFLAVANVIGKNKAETNVARSAIEENKKQRSLLSAIYKIYINHIRFQIDRLKDSGFSINKALNEAGYLTSPLFNPNYTSLLSYSNSEIIPENKEILLDTVNELPSIIVINNTDKEEILSASELKERNKIKIISSLTFNSIQQLLEESKNKIPFKSVLQLVDDTVTLSDDEILLCNYSKFNFLHSSIFESYGPESIKVNRVTRWIEFNYSFKKENQWSVVRRENLKFRSRYPYSLKNANFYIPDEYFEISGLQENEIGVLSYGDIFLASNNPITKYIKEKLEDFNTDSKYSELLKSAFLHILIGEINNTKHYRLKNDFTRLDSFIDQRFEGGFNLANLWKIIDKKEFFEVMTSLEYELYDINNWNRNM